MMKLVNEAWVGPVFSKHPIRTEDQQKEDWKRFAEFCGGAIETGQAVSPEESWKRLKGDGPFGEIQRGIDGCWQSPIGHSGTMSEQEAGAWPSLTGHGTFYPHLNLSGSRFPLPRLRGERLRKRALRMTSKAMGPDGWAAEDLLLLPLDFWEALADILQCNEELCGRHWPSSLLWAIISLIPKGEGLEPINQRPITVFSVVYRLYTAIRYEDTESWQESWMPDEVYGARIGREALDATWELALGIEESYLEQRQLIAALLDNSKYFDFFIRHVVWPTLVHLGAPLGAHSNRHEIL